MKLHNLSGRRKTGYTTWGCIWEQGSVQKGAEFELRDAAGGVHPMQSRITAWWPDGSVKWTAHTADAKYLTEEIEVLPGRSYQPEKTIHLRERASVIEIDAGILHLEIPYSGPQLLRNVQIGGRRVIEQAYPVLQLEKPLPPEEAKGTEGVKRIHYGAVIEKVEVECSGPLQAVIRYDGWHESREGERRLPFKIRLRVGYGSRRLHFMHTFVYDGEEDQDFLKGLGVRFEVPMKGPAYNRHVKFEGDHGCFHEALALMLAWHGLDQSHYPVQMSGQPLLLAGEELAQAKTDLANMPVWSEYELTQDSPGHFGIRKKVADADCCYLDCLHGAHTKGAAAFGSENGSIVFGVRDFYEKYPTGYTFKNLDQDLAQADVWLWPPRAEAMDFRHYANRGYNQVYYEGFDFKGATPYGIACTNEFSMMLLDEMIPSDFEVCDFSDAANTPAQYVGEVAYYHQLRAFGYWSQDKRGTEVERWLEEQMEQAVNFYLQEVKQRKWYGMFNYGDFMHTYDPARHQWRYDMGGYAWDNTELVPTLWLWLMFMRTGREDIFTLAEKLSRHTSEVDVYHMGDLKGLGSRHNVRHWGCPCKEARIAMAAHHRFYYYMTGDYRMGDIFEELKDNERTFLHKDPLELFYEKEKMVYPSHARSGPDWSSLCANWMTRWERFGDAAYRDKIVTGIEDLKKAPLQLISGPDFEFDPRTVHLRYIGENAAGGTHLQICMGAPQVWFEMADWLNDEEWKKMMADYGRFYYLDREQQQGESKGLIGDREFSLPFMAAAMGAYGAAYLDNPELARTTWQHLLGALIHDGNWDGFASHTIKEAGNHSELHEIPWISTNFAAQWCLNVIMVLEFCREALPQSCGEVDQLLADVPALRFRKA